MTPTQRSLARMRELGYHAEVTERWIPGANIRKDLWTFCDILCLHTETGAIVAVQTTSYSNVSERIRKIEEAVTTPLVRKAGIRILVHGWRKRGRGWICREVDVS